MKSRIKILPLIICIAIIFSLLPCNALAAGLRITEIKDLNTSAYVNQSYSLPKTVVATINNKTTQKVAVTWNPKTAVTSKSGTFIFKGTVKGYSKQVILTLKVQKAPDAEILRAINYGFVPDIIRGDWDKAVTFKQYCIMLKNMLSLYNNKLVPKWEKTGSRALASNDIMHRDHGMLATYYAACLMGIGQTTNGNWQMNQFFDIDLAHGFDWDYEKWFPDYNRKSPFYNIEHKKQISGWNYDVSARYWCVGQTSCVSGNRVFDIDFQKKTVRPMDDFNRKDAIHAVLRVYESTFTIADKPSANDTNSKEILSLADIRRASIINSETSIIKSNIFVQGKTYTGIAYYVSNNGNDTNEGTSPETAWATISKVNTAELKYGDSVFFRRGDTWYGQLWGQEGVTYSAYGTGSKPIISGSVEENAAAPDKWKLYYEGKKGEKIWAYYRDLIDCSGIFFNSGESWANKVTPCWNGKQYVTDTGKSFSALTGLTQDLDYFSCLDLTKINPFDRVSETGVNGPLYLRCDAGNPGELYSEIEFTLDGSGISPSGHNGKDMTVDNLKVVFFANVGMSCASYQGWTNTVIQNCEIGWCGGGITKYSYKIGGKFAYANTSGGALQMSGPYNTALDNYIHHCASKAVVIAIHDRESSSFIYNDILVKNNLFEYNSAALHLANYMESENPSEDSGFKNVIFDDNYVLYTGYGWVDIKTQRTDFMLERLPFCSIEFGGEYVNKNEGIYIRNNIFYLSKYALINCNMPEGNQPIFSGNTYAQNENGWLALLRCQLLSVTENGEKYVRDELLDKIGNVLTIK